VFLWKPSTCRHVDPNSPCFSRRSVVDSPDLSQVAYFLMTVSSPIDQELRAAEAAWKAGQEGKARVCARRAVALAATSWLIRVGEAPWPGDAMEQLRRIQRHAAFPPQVREAAVRLSTAVTRRQEAPFTADPLSDASLIIGHLAADARDTEFPSMATPAPEH
jgi:hypothetical protein